MFIYLKIVIIPLEALFLTCVICGIHGILSYIITLSSSVLVNIEPPISKFEV